MGEGDWPCVVNAATMVIAIRTRRIGLVFMIWSLEEGGAEGKTVGCRELLVGCILAGGGGWEGYDAGKIAGVRGAIVFVRGSGAPTALGFLILVPSPCGLG